VQKRCLHIVDCPFKDLEPVVVVLDGERLGAFGRQRLNGQFADATLLTAVPQVLLVAAYSPSIHTDVALLGSAAMAG